MDKNEDIFFQSEVTERILSSRMVLMCGISGSGKTVFSKKLEAKGFVRLSVDELVWSWYGERLQSLPFEEQRELFMKASEDILSRALRLLEEGESVVVDSTMCKRFKRNKFKEACMRSFGIDPLIIYLEASLPLLLKRLSERTGIGPNDQKVTEGQLEMFYANFESPDPDENFSVVRQAI